MTDVDRLTSKWLMFFYEGIRSFVGSEEEMVGMFDLDVYRRQEPELDRVMGDIISALSEVEFEEEGYAKKYFKNLSAGN